LRRPKNKRSKKRAGKGETTPNASSSPCSKKPTEKKIRGIKAKERL